MGPFTRLICECPILSSSVFLKVILLYFQLECHACGNDWWTSRDEASTLTIDGSNSRNVGTAPLATAKFEDVEKLVSPRENKKSATDLLKKTTEAKMPVLDNQRSFNKSRSEDNVAATTAES